MRLALVATLVLGLVATPVQPAGESTPPPERHAERVPVRPAPRRWTLPTGPDPVPTVPRWAAPTGPEALPIVRITPLDRRRVVAARRLRVAGFQVGSTLDDAEAAAVAGSLALRRLGRVDARSLVRLVRRAEAEVRDALAVAGLRAGTITPGHIRRAARHLGVPVRDRLRPAHTRRVVERSQALSIRALALLGIDHGTAVDPRDWRRAAQEVGLEVGRRVDPGDVVAIRRRADARIDRQGGGAVVPGLAYDRYRVDLAGGPAIVHRLSWRLDDPRIAVRSEPAGAFNTRASAVAAFDRRLARGVVATVNGGFWMGSGDPDGLLVTGGRLVSEPGTLRDWVGGARAAFGWSAATHVVGRPEWRGRAGSPERGWVPLRAIDRAAAGGVVVRTPASGRTTATRRGTFELALARVRLPGSGHVGARVIARSRAGNLAIPAHGLVLSAASGHEGALRRFRRGDRITLSTTVAGFAGVREAMAGGPLLVTDGKPTTRADWNREGFGPRHNAVRHPRTAVGFRRDGQAFVLVVDGRQPGYSVGATTAETTRLMRLFGAVDAVMLDGGGSSQMVFGGRTVNRDCCDGSHRAVATVLAFYARRV